MLVGISCPWVRHIIPVIIHCRHVSQLNIRGVVILLFLVDIGGLRTTQESRERVVPQKGAQKYQQKGQ
jgi:hypothetical protein